LYSKLEDKESATNEGHQTIQYKIRQQPQPTTANSNGCKAQTSDPLREIIEAATQASWITKEN